MMEKSKRILVVDNDKDVLKSMRFMLGDDYEILSADTVETAYELIDREIFHLAIVDIRLEDETHPSDTTGFKIAQKLPPDVPFIIYTAYDDKQNIRQALSKIGAKEIIDKKGLGASKELIEAVNTLFESQVNVNFNLKFEGPLNLEQMAREIEIPSPDEQLQPSKEDVRQVFQVLFKKADMLQTMPLLAPQPAPTTSQGGALVVQAEPHFLINGPGVPKAVKFCTREEADQEVHNYEQIKDFLGGQRLAILEGKAYSRQIGGLVYSLIGADNWQSIRTFADVYNDEPTEKVISLLEQFFAETFKRPFTYARREKIDLTATYTTALHLTPQNLQTAVQQFHPPHLLNGHLKFPEFEEDFNNPIEWAMTEDKFRSFETISRKYLCHGDLHSRNILVDDENHFWLIDFAQATESHILRDFAKLETDIKFNLLSEADLTKLLPFEQGLLAPQEWADEPPDITFDDIIVHAYKIIAALRRIASRLVALEGDMSEYYEALFFNALNVTRLPHLQPEKKEHALLSAALISRRLDGWPNKFAALAEVENLEPQSPLILGREYTLLTGITHNISSHLADLDPSGQAYVGDMIIDITVYSTGLEILPNWIQQLKLGQTSDKTLLEFKLVPQKTGAQEIEIEFYYQKAWLTRINLTFEVNEEKSET
ncbi:MAG TPA: response regulator [Anaerolineae bacterium]